MTWGNSSSHHLPLSVQDSLLLTYFSFHGALVSPPRIPLVSISKSDTTSVKTCVCVCVWAERPFRHAGQSDMSISDILCTHLCALMLSRTERGLTVQHTYCATYISFYAPAFFHHNTNADMKCARRDHKQTSMEERERDPVQGMDSNKLRQKEELLPSHWRGLGLKSLTRTLKNLFANHATDCSPQQTQNIITLFYHRTNNHGSSFYFAHISSPRYLKQNMGPSLISTQH